MTLKESLVLLNQLRNILKGELDFKIALVNVKDQDDIKDMTISLIDLIAKIRLLGE